jgi:hypothetical protein
MLKRYSCLAIIRLLATTSEKKIDDFEAFYFYLRHLCGSRNDYKSSLFCIFKFSVNDKRLRFQFLTTFAVDMNWDQPQVSQILGFFKELSPPF